MSTTDIHYMYSVLYMFMSTHTPHSSTCTVYIYSMDWVLTCHLLWFVWHAGQENHCHQILSEISQSEGQSRPALLSPVHNKGVAVTSTHNGNPALLYQTPPLNKTYSLIECQVLSFESEPPFLPTWWVLLLQVSNLIVALGYKKGKGSIIQQCIEVDPLPTRFSAASLLTIFWKADTHKSSSFSVSAQKR